ncbi:MAG: hypothetical protein NZ551_00925 [Microscillaceae bacterium]|nr:hypothetical protein [Microscillaceae bacterium]MDW8459751.1 hypothetical protein [Cytophagales bacterium]
MKFYKKIIAISIGIIGWVACNMHSSQENTDTTRTTAKNPETPKIRIDEEATALACMFGAVQPIKKGNLDSIFQLPSVQKHYEEFNKNWQKLEESRLSKMRVWAKQELGKWITEPYNLFYPFSGPDFLNAYELFPNCDNYLLFGLEQLGELPNFKKAKADYIDKYLHNIRDALSEIFERNYFITSYMSGDLHVKYIRGVLPLISVFLARTNNQIVKIERFVLNPDGQPQYYPLEQTKEKKDIKGIHGISIEFLNQNKKKTQKIYYIATDLEDKVMPQKQEVVKFIKSFDKKITLIKSASYLLHGYNFSTIRNIILEDTKAVLQDDTGVPYSFYKEQNWKVQLYGKYDRPIADFKYGFQPDLNKRFQTDSTVKPLNFTFGYHWKTDKTSLLFCVAPAQPAVKKTENKNVKNSSTIKPQNRKQLQ